MPYRLTPFVSGEFYHIFNRGVEKRTVFTIPTDYDHFLEMLYYYQYDGPKPRFSQFRRFKNSQLEDNPKIIEIICYCLMPNHFHLLIRQLKEGGISEFMRKCGDSYTKYFNTKNKRVGSLFQGSFKAVHIESEEQFLHVSRYIHLNPLVGFLIKNLDKYVWSSYPSFINQKHDKLLSKEPILSFFQSTNEYQTFVLDQADYGSKLELIKHHLLDE